MKMNDTVARIVEIMFQDVEMNEETSAIRDEVMNNCQERYLDLVSSGMNEDDAIAAVIESLKGMEEVLAPYKMKANRHEADNELDDLDDLDDEEEGERNMTFRAEKIHQISACLISEDITLEASADDDYHVIWDANDNPLIHAEMVNGVLKVERRLGDAVKTERDGNVDFSDFVRTEDGKIEINMDGFESAMKSMGEKIKMQFSNCVGISFGAAGSEVTIQIPEYAIPHVKLLTTSGDIEVQNVALTDLIVTSTSGDIDVDLDEDANLSRAEIRTTSGDIEANFYADIAQITSTSGDVTVEGRVNDLMVSAISGDIDMRADVVNITFRTVSGDVEMDFDGDAVRTVNGSTISGDIEIDLPSGLGFMDIRTQTRSGDVTTHCHTNGVGPTVTGNVTSMSGDITIR